MDTTRIYKNIIIVALLISTFAFAGVVGGDGSFASPYQIDGCGSYADPGYYQLINSIHNPTVTDNTCISFLSSVNFDCQNNYIYMNGTSTEWGIKVEGNYSNISNCNIVDTNEAEGIIIIDASNVTLDNIHASSETYYSIALYSDHTSLEYASNLYINNSEITAGFPVMVQRYNSIADSYNLTNLPMVTVENSYLNGSSSSLIVQGQNTSVSIPFKIRLINSELQGDYGTATVSLYLKKDVAATLLYIMGWRNSYGTIPTPPSTWDMLYGETVAIGALDNLSDTGYITWNIQCGDIPINSPLSAQYWDGSSWQLLNSTIDRSKCPITINASIPYNYIGFSNFTDSGDVYPYTLFSVMYVANASSITPSELDACPIAVEVMYRFNEPASYYKVSIQYGGIDAPVSTLLLNDVNPLDRLYLEMHGLTFNATTDRRGFACFNQTSFTINGHTYSIDLTSATNTTAKISIYDSSNHLVYTQLKFISHFVVIVINPFLSFEDIIVDALTMGINLYILFSILGLLFVTQFGVERGGYYGGFIIIVILIVLNLVGKISLAQNLISIAVFGMTVGLISWIFRKK